MKKILLLLSISLITVVAKAQETGFIKGKLIDHSTKQPIVGGKLIVQNQEFKAFSDTSGNFTIKNVPEGNYTLEVSGYSYQSKNITDVVVTRNKAYYIEIELLEEVFTAKEVEVKAYKYENDPTMPVSTYSFSREEIFRNPGAQGDIFRAIGILPGVSSSGGQFSAIAVRGQGTNDNVYMVDDIPMFNLSHLEGSYGGFTDPNGGRFSIFAPRIIDNAVFQGGGFSSQFGRRSASYLGLNIKEGNKATASLSGQFDLLGGTLIYDGPSYAFKNTSVFASARYQNFKQVVKMVGIEDVGLPIYGDYILKTTTNFGTKNKLSFVGMYNPESFERNIDHFKLAKKVENNNLGDFKNNKTLIGLNLRTLVGTKSYWKNVAYYRTMNIAGNIGIANPLSDSTGIFDNKVNIPFEKDLRYINNQENEIGYRSIFTTQIKSSTLTAGVDLQRVEIDYNRKLKHTDTLYTFNSTDYRPNPNQYYTVLPTAYFNSHFKTSKINASAYVDYAFKVFKILSINAGLRYDYTGFTESSHIAPRLSGSAQINDKSSINFATGIFYQDPYYGDVADNSARGKLKNPKVNQYIIGYKNQISTDVKFVVESWYKTFNNLLTRPQTGEIFLENKGDGFAYGADINVTKRLSRKYYGQVGYSYQLSKRDDHDGKGLYNFTFSQPNMISFLGSYKPNSRWVFSTKFRYATGRPKNSYIVHNNVFNDANFVRYSQEITGKNDLRLNDFMSLDIRVDYKFQIKKYSLTTFLDIVDILNRYNQSDELFQPITGNVYHDGLAIFPTFGLRIEM